MAKILTFQSKESAASAQNFLTDETEKLSFRTADDGAVSIGDMSPTSLPSILPDPKKDWSNQELADLFRVKQLLSGANVPVETMRGVTDEGDPWFIFCHFNGDVFIHMARIDGRYVLDSPNVRRPLRGADFNALIADFTGDALPSSASAEDGDTERRVVRLERGGKVRLHPSAMLAALIWTLFLASEELVMMLPEKQAAGSDDLLDFSDVISADFDFHAVENETADVAGLAQQQSATTKEITDDVLQNTLEAQVQMRDAALAQQGMAMHQNAFAMGLSTIAIAMGFMSEAVLLDNQRKVLEELKAIGLPQYATDSVEGPELDQIAGAEGNTLVDMLAEFLGLDLSLNTEMAEAATDKGDASLLQQNMLHVTTQAIVDAPLEAITTVQAIVRDRGDSDLSETPTDTADNTADDLEALIVMASAAQTDATVSIADLIGDMYGMEEFQLGQTTIMASFDLSMTNALALVDYIGTSQRTSVHSEFDDRAQAFIDFIQAKDGDVGVVSINNEIIMIDRETFHKDSAAIYSFSWETNEGEIISLIGLRAEFQEFDLIA